MAKIVRVEILQVDLVPKAVRTDAIQSFATQETTASSAPAIPTRSAPAVRRW
jgi:hypothetical protein